MPTPRLFELNDAGHAPPRATTVRSTSTIDSVQGLRLMVALVAACLAIAATPALADGAIAVTVRAQLQQAAASAFPDASRVVIAVRDDVGAGLPACPVPLTIDTQRQHLRGHVGVTVRCPAQAGWHTYVGAQVSLFFPVVVSQTAIVRGVRVTANQVAVAERELTGSGGAYFSKLEQVLGQQTRQPIAMGQVIAPWQLDRPNLIQRGERVALHAGGGEFQVTTSGEALDNGRLGEQVRVRNASSGKIVYGWVDSAGSVSARPPAS